MEKKAHSDATDAKAMLIPLHTSQKEVPRPLAISVAIPMMSR